MMDLQKVDKNLALLEKTLKPVADYRGRFLNDAFSFGNSYFSRIEFAELARKEELAFDSLRAALIEVSESIQYREYMKFNDVPAEYRSRADILLKLLNVDLFVDLIPTLDFALEVRNRALLASESENQGVYFFLIAVSGWSDKLKRENHDSKGYHFHYIDTKGGPTRTNVLLTFNPVEPLGPPDALYWERHGGYFAEDPRLWGLKRCVAIHSAAVPSTLKPGKAHFLRPGDGASILCVR